MIDYTTQLHKIEKHFRNNFESEGREIEFEKLIVKRRKLFRVWSATTTTTEFDWDNGTERRVVVITTYHNTRPHDRVEIPAGPWEPSPLANAN